MHSQNIIKLKAKLTVTNKNKPYPFKVEEILLQGLPGLSLG